MCRAGLATVRELRWLRLRRHGMLGLGPVAGSGGGTRLADLPSSCGSGQRLYRTLVMVRRPCVAAAGTTTPSVVHCDIAEGMFEARAKAYTVTSVDATTYMDTSSSFLFSRLASPDACRCAPPIVAGESGNSSVRYGGDQHPPIPLSRQGTCQCAPPTIAGESKNGSTRCGGGRHPFPLSRHGRLQMRASHQCERVREWLSMMW